MSRGSFRTQENIYPIDDPRYGMTPEQVRAYNLHKEAQESERRRIEEDILANPFEQEDAPIVLTPQEEKELKDLERSGFLEEGDYQERVKDFKEGDRPFEQPSHEEIQTMESDGYRTNILAFNPDYVTATDLNSAKELADSYYIEHLTRELANAPTAEQREQIQKLIDKGAPSFDNIEDYQRYEDLNNTVNRLGEEGFVSFDTTEEATEWQNKAKETSLSPEQFVNRAELDALDYQKKVMGDYILTYEPEKADKNVLGRDLSDEENPLGITKTYSVNTGTAFNSPLEYQRIDGVPTVDEKAEIGGFGEYQLIGSDQVFSGPSGISKAIGDGLSVLSFIYPPLAPIFSAGKTLLAGGDIGDALTAGAKVYAGGKITKELSGFTEELFTDINIDLSSLPEPVKQTLVDTTAGVIVGQDPKEALTNSIIRQGKDYAADYVAGEIKSVTGDLGQDLKAFLGLPEDYEIPEPLQNIVDDTTSALIQGDSASDALVGSIEGEAKDVIGDFAEDTTKELLSGAEDLIGESLSAFDDAVIQPIITPIKPVLTAVGDVVGDVIIDPVDEVIDYIGDSPVVETIEDIGKDIGETFETVVTDPVDEVIDYIGDEYVDPTLQALDEALPHGTTPELPDGPDIDIDLDLPSPVVELEEPKSQVAGLFDKELGEIYKHDIYELPQLFSDERIQGMLSRKYRV